MRQSIVEDMALGRLLAGRGYRIATLRGERLGSVRMYRDLASIREGFGKNAHAFLAGQPGRGVRVALSSACAGVTLPLLGEADAWPRRRPAAAAVVGRGGPGVLGGAGTRAGRLGQAVRRLAPLRPGAARGGDGLQRHRGRVSRCAASAGGP